MASTPTPSPALDPPDGIQSDFEHPESLATISDVTVGICLSVITVFFALRSYVRLFLRRSWTWEDWFATLAWAGTVMYCSAIATTMAHHGGEHTWDITKDEAKDAQYWFSVATIFYGFTIPFTKLTILWLYRRVFVSQRWSTLDVAIVTVAAVQGLFYLAHTTVKIFQCTPRARIWDKDVAGSCVDTSVILNMSGFFNVISDAIILALPIPTVWKLRIETKKKLLVTLVFTFGLCAPAFSIAGLLQRVRTSADKDFSWNQPGIQFWGAAELTAGLLCFCFPELGILFRSTKRRTESGTYHGTDGSGSQSHTHPRSFGHRGSLMHVQRPGHADRDYEMGTYTKMATMESSSEGQFADAAESSLAQAMQNVTVKQEFGIEVETIPAETYKPRPAPGR